MNLRTPGSIGQSPLAGCRLAHGEVSCFPVKEGQECSGKIRVETGIQLVNHQERSLGQRFQGWLAEVQKQSRSWNTPFRNLKTIEAYLKPSCHFRNEIAEIKTYIKELELERQKFKLA